VLLRKSGDLLDYLILNRGNIITKQMVEDKIYIFKEMGESALKNIIYKLRKKLVKNVIITVDRIGYKIE
jgi:DNA-binding winged helix-turn-helix (wHTH) protein